MIYRIKGALVKALGGYTVGELEERLQRAYALGKREGGDLVRARAVGLFDGMYSGNLNLGKLVKERL